VRPSIEDIGAMITPPIQETPSSVAPYVSFEDQTGRISANASMVAANRPPSSGGGGGGVTLSISDDGFSDPTMRYSGKDPDAVKAAYERGSGKTPAPAAAQQSQAAKLVSTAKAQGAKITVKGNIITAVFPSGQVRNFVVKDGQGSNVEIQKVK
jgi:hypothetical protein